MGVEAWEVCSKMLIETFILILLSKMLILMIEHAEIVGVDCLFATKKNVLIELLVVNHRVHCPCAGECLDLSQ